MILGIKPKNILIDKANSIVLGDFWFSGTSGEIQSRNYKPERDRGFYAHELILKNKEQAMLLLMRVMTVKAGVSIMYA